MAWPITAADVHAELGWRGDPDTPLLAPFAAAAVERIEAEIGLSSGQDVTVTVSGPARVITLPGRAASLTSVTVDGVAQDLAGFVLDGPAGLVTGVFGPGQVVVVVKAPATVPGVVELATRLLAATWVRQSKVGPPGPTTRAAAPDTDVAQGFAMPRRVSEMIRPWTVSWGFA